MKIVPVWLPAWLPLPLLMAISITEGFSCNKNAYNLIHHFENNKSIIINYNGVPWVILFNEKMSWSFINFRHKSAGHFTTVWEKTPPLESAPKHPSGEKEDGTVIVLHLFYGPLLVVVLPLHAIPISHYILRANKCRLARKENWKSNSYKAPVQV